MSTCVCTWAPCVFTHTHMPTHSVTFLSPNSSLFPPVTICLYGHWLAGSRASFHLRINVVPCADTHTRAGGVSGGEGLKLEVWL